MRHHSLPATLTPELLAEWITNNKMDTFSHVDRIPLTEDEIQALEHMSSAASRAERRLTDLQKMIVETIKKGTPYNTDKEDHEPVAYTIPPTKGIDALKANREFADKRLELGYREEETKLYLIPNPEQSNMVMVDIEGVEWPEYSRNMTKDEINQFKPLLKGQGQKLKYEGKDASGAATFSVKEAEEDLEEADDFTKSEDEASSEELSL